MLVIGTMDLTTTRETGSFFCPECSVNRPFRRRRSRPFLTLYFIPVFPIGGASEHIECEVCKTKFADTVLGFTAEDYQHLLATEEFDHIRHAMVLTMLADDQVDDAEVDAIQEICEEMGQQVISKDELLNDVNLARRAKTNLVKYLETVAGDMSNLCKDQLVKACFLVATGTGELDQQKTEYLEKLPDALKMSHERFRAAVEMALDPPEG